MHYSHITAATIYVFKTDMEKLAARPCPFIFLCARRGDYDNQKVINYGSIWARLKYLQISFETIICGFTQSVYNWLEVEHDHVISL